MLLPLGAAVIALAAALAAYVMVKFFGVVFLGQPREAALADAHDAGWLERAGSRCGWRSGCVALGLLPTQVIALLGLVPEQLGFVESTTTVVELVASRPVAGAPGGVRAARIPAGHRRRRSSSPVGLVSVLYHRRVRRGPPWDCGFARLDARMQDTRRRFWPADSPHLRGVFRHAARTADAVRSRAALPVVVGDRFWRLLYLPLARIVQRVAEAVAWLQQGRIATYLLYSFVTLLVLLVFVL